jgi:hypothetical protein
MVVYLALHLVVSLRVARSVGPALPRFASDLKTVLKIVKVSHRI